MHDGTAPYRVTHLIPTTANGGVRRYVQQCSTMRGVRSSVIAIFATKEPSDMDLGSEGEIQLGIPLSRYREVDMIEAKVTAAVRRLQPDLLHSHHFGCDIFCSAAKAHVSAGCMIRHVHGVLQRSTEQPMGQKMVRFDWTSGEISREQRVEHFVHRTICVSNELRDKLARYGLPSEKLVVLPNAIDPERFTPSSDQHRQRARMNFGLGGGEYIIGFLGRIEPCKNVNYLIKLALQQQHLTPRPKYLVVGSGPLEAELKREAGYIGLSSMFSFHWPRLDVRDFYAAIDVLLMPSYIEGSPFVLLEAMASEVAVIASAVGGVCEIVRNKIDGLLIDPNDVGSGLMAVASLSDPTRRSRLARQGRERAITAFGILSHQSSLNGLYEGAIRSTANE